MKRGLNLAIQFFAIAVLTALDQWFKFLVNENLELFESVTVINGVLDFRHIRNYGAAFGLLEGHRWLLVWVTAALILTGIIMIAANIIKGAFLRWAAVLIVAGGLGNLINRFFDGFVIDYLQLRFWPLHNFSIFNFADILVVTGTMMLIAKTIIYDTIKERKAMRDDFDKLAEDIAEHDDPDTIIRDDDEV